MTSTPKAGGSSSKGKGKGEGKERKRTRGRLNLEDVMKGRFPALNEQLIFDPALVVEVYTQLRSNDFDSKKVHQLECNSYLERYLWPFYDLTTSSSAHIMSVILIVNEKLREIADRQF